MTTDDPAAPRPASPPTDTLTTTTSGCASLVRLNVGGVRYETTMKTLVDDVSWTGGWMGR